ncbi:unnamed protein product [Rotaria sordida]|uniref:CSD domain-containing protein n=1 Tax=Rotaria sordida TaxID=392033 RepID=A0A818PPG0_9BILA|nr:unnamed protein product [Rotaria sordida]CAF0822039.1 unnamed protein product [Rotaria sordida]CAF3510545.1 unnamed protein product [Rotaria sordida]CAF3626413.1 unnamed protein product [Rotaria sordida]
MLSNIFVRLLTSVRPIHNYQQHFVRLLSTAETMSNETSSSNREKGVVKRFSKEKGFGFISKTSDGTDYFVHFKNINATGFRQLEQGQEVEFTATQGEKGLEAKDVSIIDVGTSRKPFFERSSDDESPSPRRNFGTFSRNQSSSSSSSVFNFGGTASSKLQFKEQESTSTEKPLRFSENLTSSTRENLFSSKKPRITNEQTRELGSVKRWTPERGFGFIRRTNSGQDLFCHVRSLKDGVQSLEPGQIVEYGIQQTDKGEEARDVIIVKDDGFKNQQQDTTSTTNLGERQTGTVKKWLTGRGYGFVQRDTGGSDIFVHVRNLSNGIQSLEEGQLVEFNIAKNEKGEMAQNVTILNETKNEKSETSENVTVRSEALE